MKTFRILISVCVLIGVSIYCYANVSKQDDLDQIIYSHDSYDKFRQMDYWGATVFSVQDYDYNSGDTAYLKLCSKDPNSSVGVIPNRELAAHYQKEFERLIQGKIPFHDIYKGRSDRLKAFTTQHPPDRDRFMEAYEEFEAQEEARNRAMFGSNPGAFYCIIQISRRTFPVLYQMTSKVGAGEINYLHADLEQKKLGYSTPEHIADELKRSMTEQFEALSKKLAKIKSIKK